MGQPATQAFVRAVESPVVARLPGPACLLNPALQQEKNHTRLAASGATSDASGSVHLSTRDTGGLTKVWSSTPSLPISRLYANTVPQGRTWDAT